MSKSILVLNQSQTPAFQQLLEQATAPAPVCFLTAQSVTPAREGVTTRSAPSYRRTSVPARAASWLAYASYAGVFAAATRSDYVLAVTNPPFLPHVAWALSRLGSKRYGLLVWDIYPQHLNRVGLLPAEAALSKTWREVNGRALSGADFVVTISESMRDTLATDYRPRPNSLHVIPNWADTDSLRPMPRCDNPWARRLGLSDELLVVYSGNVGATHGLEGLVAAAARLRHRTDIKFMIVGHGLGLPSVRAEVQSRGLHNVEFLPPQSWSDFPLLMAAADVAVVSQAPGTEHLSIPSKTHSSMAAGAAVLALTSEHSDLAHLVARHRIGSVCAPHDVQAIATALEGWRDTPERLQFERERSRETAELEYSMQVTVAKWRHVMRDWLGPEN